MIIQIRYFLYLHYHSLLSESKILIRIIFDSETELRSVDSNANMLSASYKKIIKQNKLKRWEKGWVTATKLCTSLINNLVHGQRRHFGNVIFSMKSVQLHWLRPHCTANAFRISQFQLSSKLAVTQKLACHFNA